MRGSTAAGINNSLLPRDCNCGEFAGGHLLVVPSGERPLFGVCWISGSAVWGKASFSWHLCGICRWYYTGRGLFPLAFVAFGTFGTGEGFLGYGICARCAKQPPVVRGAFSEALRAQNRLLRYGRDIRYRKPPSLVRSRYSVRKTASCGTRRIFRGIRC